MDKAGGILRRAPKYNCRATLYLSNFNLDILSYWVFGIPLHCV